jgi:hypothetical protein
LAFHFEKPAHFKFIADHAADFTLHHPPRPIKRATSAASPRLHPYEEDLTFAARMRNTAIKRSTQSILLGTELTLEPPWAELTRRKSLF